MSKKIRAYWFGGKNFGDKLTPIENSDENKFTNSENKEFSI